ncbi:MAG: hypothetical protein ACK5TE_14055 [Pseudomonadota bacterium]
MSPATRVDLRWRQVPRGLRLALALALGAQLLLAALQPNPRARREPLPAPPSIEALRAMAMAEPASLALAGALWLQSHDTQPGLSIPHRALDYERLAPWLRRLLELDPTGQYPLLLASHVYSQVPDAERQRRMLLLVREAFDADPDRRWRWLAHAALVARHRLGDAALAIEFATAITRKATGPAVPSWARQMSVLLLADTGESQAASVLLGGLIDAGLVTDPAELRFLLERGVPAPPPISPRPPDR